MTDPLALAGTPSSPRTALGRWPGQLSLRYARDAQGRTVGHDTHEGPLRVLKALYPEGEGICHHVLVHPPGGVAGGDHLALNVQLAPHAHALVTTPGATRFYRTTGAPAEQVATLSLAAGARLEWLPLEAIAYPGCLARNEVRFELAAGAQMLGWDLLALGLPAAAAEFTSGRFEQHLAWPGVWIERGVIDAQDQRLLHSPLGLGGASVLGTLWWASGTPLDEAQRNALLDAAREAAGPAQAADGALRAGATAPDARLVVLRALSTRVEPLAALFARTRRAWRRLAWQIDGADPRVWRT